MSSTHGHYLSERSVAARSAKPFFSLVPSPPELGHERVPRLMAEVEPEQVGAPLIVRWSWSACISRSRGIVPAVGITMPLFAG